MKNSLTAYHIQGKQSELGKEDNKQFFEQPLNFVRRVRSGSHIVLFYEDAHYASMILYEFLKSGLVQKEDCTYISEKDTESVKKEMNDTWTGIKEFLNNDQLLIYQIPNLASHSQVAPQAETNAVCITSMDKGWSA